MKHKKNKALKKYLHDVKKAIMAIINQKNYL